jgi:hypothetical protein
MALLSGYAKRKLKLQREEQMIKYGINRLYNILRVNTFNSILVKK